MRCARPAVSRAPRGTPLARAASLARVPQQAIRSSPLSFSPRQSSLPSATPLVAFRAFRSAPPSRVALAVHEPVQPAIISENNYVNVALLFGAAAVLLWLSTEERAAAEELWSKGALRIINAIPNHFSSPATW